MARLGNPTDETLAYIAEAYSVVYRSAREYEGRVPEDIGLIPFLKKHCKLTAGQAQRAAEALKHAGLVSVDRQGVVHTVCITDVTRSAVTVAELRSLLKPEDDTRSAEVTASQSAVSASASEQGNPPDSAATVNGVHQASDSSQLSTDEPDVHSDDPLVTIRYSRLVALAAASEECAALRAENAKLRAEMPKDMPSELDARIQAILEAPDESSPSEI